MAPLYFHLDETRVGGKIRIARIFEHPTFGRRADFVGLAILVATRLPSALAWALLVILNIKRAIGIVHNKARGAFAGELECLANHGLVNLITAEIANGSTLL